MRSTAALDVFWRGEKFLASAGIQIPDHPARTLAAIQTSLPPLTLKFDNQKDYFTSLLVLHFSHVFMRAIEERAYYTAKKKLAYISFSHRVTKQHKHTLTRIDINHYRHHHHYHHIQASCPVQNQEEAFTVF